MDKERIEEALELLWELQEAERSDLENFRLGSDDPDAEAVISALQQEGLITMTGGAVSLTAKGAERARGLVRRHRLAERLFMEVFDLSEEVVHEDACRVEHILSEELTDSVCTFLGHPPTCPHGNPIPRGECCRKYRVDVQPVVVRLAEFEVGQKGKIVFITSSEAARIGRLSSIGIVPGAVIRLLQRRPSIVVQIDETTIAIDPELAREIFIKKVA
ncbi:MAG: metal-dependent transcriptional regulator [Thermodesulfovibrionales bacterium]|jgi:DtxR family Mn-dependent transcriptional regulator